MRWKGLIFLVVLLGIVLALGMIFTDRWLERRLENLGDSIVGAKVDIYHIINNLAASGVGILFISSELPEILGMSDRALVMREGRLVGEFTRAQASEEKLLACAAGVAQ